MLKIEKHLDKINSLEIGESFETKKYIVECIEYLPDKTCKDCDFYDSNCIGILCGGKMYKATKKGKSGENNV